ncbi:unnamed protein product, partial [Medioppia subpectinata]
MASLLLSLQQQFADNTADITQRLIQLQNNVINTDNRQTLLVDVKRLLDETNELLEQMDLDVRSSDGHQRDQHLTHLDAFRKQYDTLCADFRNAKRGQSAADESTARLELMGDYEVGADDQKALLLSEDTRRMEASERRLEDGYRICVESERIGGQILDNLSQQRDTIQRSTHRLRATNRELSRGHKLLSLMTRRSRQLLRHVSNCEQLADNKHSYLVSSDDNVFDLIKDSFKVIDDFVTEEEERSL